MVYKSRYGFHPCSYEDFLKIKELHWLAYLDFQATKRRERWLARQPQNRTGSEPPKTLNTSKEDYQNILKDYRYVRIPMNSDPKLMIRFGVHSREDLQSYQAMYGPGDVGKNRGPRIIEQAKIA